MKFDIFREDLQAELASVGVARDGRGSAGIYKGILFDINGGRLKLAASNPEYSITKELDLNMGYCGEDFAFVVDGEFVKIIDKLDGDKVAIELLPENVVEIKCGKFKCKQSVIPAEQYIIKKVEGECIGEQKFKAETLADMIESTVYACALLGSDNNVVRTGIKITATSGKAEVIALDGYRIAIATGEYDGDIDIIISGKMLKETAKLMSGEVEIKQYSNNYVIESNGYVITASVLEGVYPDWHMIAPKNITGAFKVDRIQFLKAVERLSTISKEKKKAFVFEIKDGRLTISVNTPNNSGSEEIGIEPEGDMSNIRTGLSCTYMIDVLKSLQEDKIVVEFESAIRPFMISNEVGDRAHIVLPVRIREGV